MSYSVRGTPSEKVGTPAHDTMTKRVKTTNEVATLLNLPEKLLAKCFEPLDMRELLRVSLCSRRLQGIANGRVDGFIYWVRVTRHARGKSESAVRMSLGFRGAYSLRSKLIYSDSTYIVLRVGTIRALSTWNVFREYLDVFTVNNVFRPSSQCSTLGILHCGKKHFFGDRVWDPLE